MKFIYKNSRDEIIDLSEWPYCLQSENILDYEWSYESVTHNPGQSRITRFYKKSTEIPVEMAVYSDDVTRYVDAMNHFFQIVEYDVANCIPGKLYCNENCYLNCYILGSEKKKWKQGTCLTWYTLNIVAEDPSWIVENKKSYNISFSGDTDGLDYPYDYPSDFSSKVLLSTLENKSHLPMDFKMVIYGPVINPMVTVENNIYKINTEVKANEYLVIDTREHIVALIDNVGNKTLKYNSRDKKYDVFAKIPSGVHSVQWDGSFGFDVTAYQRRSEPEWIL